MNEQQKKHNRTCVRRKLMSAVRAIKNVETRERIAKALADQFVEMNRGDLCDCNRCMRKGL